MKKKLAALALGPFCLRQRKISNCPEGYK
jgi:hypothetical protein